MYIIDTYVVRYVGRRPFECIFTRKIICLPGIVFFLHNDTTRKWLRNNTFEVKVPFNVVNYGNLINAF